MRSYLCSQLAVLSRMRGSSGTQDWDEILAG